MELPKNGCPVTNFDLAHKMHHNTQQSDNKSEFICVVFIWFVKVSLI